MLKIATKYAILLIAATCLSAVYAQVQESRNCRAGIGAFYNKIPKHRPDVLPSVNWYNWIKTAPNLSALPPVLNSMFGQGMLELSTQTDPRTGLTYTDWLRVRLDSSWIAGRAKPPIAQGTNFAGTDTNQNVRTFVRTLGGRQSDQAGHIIARILSGTGTQNWNMFPVDGPLNRKKMATAEGSIQRIINNVPNPNLPNIVTLYVKMEYDPAPARPRPVKVHYLAEYYTNVNNRPVKNVCYWELDNP